MIVEKFIGESISIIVLETGIKWILRMNMESSGNYLRKFSSDRRQLLVQDLEVRRASTGQAGGRVVVVALYYLSELHALCV